MIVNLENAYHYGWGKCCDGVLAHDTHPIATSLPVFEALLDKVSAA